MAEYYVIRDKNTGLYFRGKGVNRWGKYYNQASVYRIKANAENTIKEVSWRGEQAEVVPIQIIENDADVVPKSEVAREIFGDVKKAIKEEVRDYCRGFESMETPEMQEYYKTKQNTAIYLYMKIDHIEKKYTEENKDDNQN